MKKSVASLSATLLLTVVAFDAAAAEPTSPSSVPVPSNPTPPSGAPGAGLPPTMTPSASSPQPGAAVLTSGDADQSVTPIPPSSRPVDSGTTTLYQRKAPNRPLLFTGAGVFVGSYVTTAAVTAGDDTSRDSSMYLPIVGPWLHLADQKESTSDSLLIAGSGVLQAAGVGLVIASFFATERVPTATIQAKSLTVKFAPTTYGPASAGLGATGTF